MPSRIIEKYRKEYGYSMKAPRITKVVVNVGIGKIVKDAKMIERIEKDLAKITGQKPAVRKAKKSIAGFKLRESTPVGLMVTLRGTRMYDFIDRLISVALPRSRDFQGISAKSFDSRGNLNIGIREQNIFPEVSYESLKDIFGLEVTVVVAATTRDESMELLKKIGFPIRHGN